MSYNYFDKIHTGKFKHVSRKTYYIGLGCNPVVGTIINPFTKRKKSNYCPKQSLYLQIIVFEYHKNERNT